MRSPRHCVRDTTLRLAAGLIAGGLLIPLSCRFGAEPEAALVTGFRSEPEAFDSFTGSTSFRYTLARPAVTSLRIALRGEGRDSTVVVLFTMLKESKGSHQHTWLGEGGDGYFVPSGRYFGILETEGESFESVVKVYHR